MTCTANVTSNEKIVNDLARITLSRRFIHSMEILLYIIDSVSIFSLFALAPELRFLGARVRREQEQLPSSSHFLTLFDTAAVTADRINKSYVRVSQLDIGTGPAVLRHEFI